MTKRLGQEEERISGMGNNVKALLHSKNSKEKKKQWLSSRD
jgi:hypothetical protein